MDQPTRILVVDDDAATRRFLQKILCKAGHEVILASNGSNGIELFDQHAPELVVLDWVMPQTTGLDVCRHIKNPTHSNYSYVVFLTTKTERDDIVFGLDVGADEYVTKPFDSDILMARINAGIRVVKMERTLRRRQEEIEAVNQRLSELAVTDPLTKLYNRRHFQEILESELNTANLGGRSLSIALVDLDNLKSINDTHGHSAGDAALKHVAWHLDQIPAPAVAARLGGDEFAIIMPGFRTDESSILFKDVCDKVRDTPVRVETGSIVTTLSIGVAGTPPIVQPTIADMLLAADRSLYLAKKQGKSQVVTCQDAVAVIDI